MKEYDLQKKKKEITQSLYSSFFLFFTLSFLWNLEKTMCKGTCLKCGFMMVAHQMDSDKLCICKIIIEVQHIDMGGGFIKHYSYQNLGKSKMSS